MDCLPPRRTTLYGQLAFASVVLATYAQLTFSDPLTGEPWQTVLTFVLGGAYSILFSTSGFFTHGAARGWVSAYFIVQTAIVATTIWISPSRGFFAILALPLVGQAVLDLPRRGAIAVGATLFATTVAIWADPYGWPGVLRAMLSYTPAYFFAVAFTFISREAIVARHKSETLAADLATANELLRAQAAQTDELATTRERNRLAREIHDGVGHYLTTIKVQLDAAVALLPTDVPRAAESVHKAARLAGEALDDVRRSVGALAADAPRPPLLDTLRQLAADGSLATALRVEGAPRTLSVAAEHALFRSAQEGLTNVRKHAAGAATTTLILDYRSPARVRLAVADDGAGSVTSSGANGTGHGLRGLRERISLLGGSVTAGAQAGGGFRLEVELPF